MRMTEEWVAKQTLDFRTNTRRNKTMRKIISPVLMHKIQSHTPTQTNHSLYVLYSLLSMYSGRNVLSVDTYCTDCKNCEGWRCRYFRLRSRHQSSRTQSDVFKQFDKMDVSAEVWNLTAQATVQRVFRGIGVVRSTVTVIVSHNYCHTIIATLRRVSL